MFKMLAIVRYTFRIINIFEINIIKLVIMTLYKILNLIFFDMLLIEF